MDTSETPIVLAFEERTACETIYLQSDDIVTTDEVVGDAELGREVGILTIADAVAVNP